MEAKKTPGKNDPKAKDAVPARSFLKTDFPFIRRATLTLAGVLAVSVVLVGASIALQSKWETDLAHSKSERTEARRKLSEADLEKQEIRQFQPKFEVLLQRGLVGEESRLMWVERLRQIQDKRQLMPLTFSFSAQKPFAVDPSVTTGDMELRGSRLNVKMDMLHELDLFHLLDDLKSIGFYRAQSCTLQRALRSADPMAPHMSADCNLYLLTMADHSQAALEAQEVSK